MVFLMDHFEPSAPVDSYHRFFFPGVPESLIIHAISVTRQPFEFAYPFFDGVKSVIMLQ